jgi:UrcA family protein
MNRFATALMITAALAVGCQLANAATPQNDMPSLVVRFADLDLTHPDGVALLYRRLQSAAAGVCASRDGRNGRDIGTQTRYETCLHDALTAAVAKADQPALSAYYRALFKAHDASNEVAQN